MLIFPVGQLRVFQQERRAESQLASSSVGQMSSVGPPVTFQPQVRGPSLLRPFYPVHKSVPETGAAPAGGGDQPGGFRDGGWG